jgi:predicted permease
MSDRDQRSTPGDRAGIRANVRRLFGRPMRGSQDAHADADAELAAVFEARVARSVERGMPLEEARAEASRHLGGGLADVRRALHRSAERRERLKWWRDATRDVGQDVRYVVRALRRRPGFTAAASLCLAIGIGANAAMFSIVDALLLRPPAGVRDPSSLIWINTQRTDPLGFTGLAGLSYPDYVDFAKSDVLIESAAYAGSEDVIGAPDDARKIAVLAVTPTFMPILGVRPAIGRFFAADDDQLGATPTAVLSYRIWQSAFDGNPAALGQSIRIGARAFTIIGVTPAEFNGVERTPVDVYLPTRSRPADSTRALTRNSSWLTMLARARPGVSRAKVAERLDIVYHRAEDGPRARSRNRVVAATPMSMVAMRNAVTVQNTTIALWLMGVALIVLVIATANVGGLLATRAARRGREISIRLALGIGRWRLVRLLVTEGVAITALGAVAGLGIAYWGGGLLRAGLIARGARTTSVFDHRILIGTLVITALTAIACGVLPALHATRQDINAAMKSGDQLADVRTERALSGLLIGQIALTIVLLVGAGLFIRSLHNLDVLDLGFDVQHSLRVRLAKPNGATPVEADLLAHRVRDVVASIPGVDRAVLATAGPFGNVEMRPIFLPGRAPAQPGENAIPPGMSAVQPGFFQTLGIRLLRGRDFLDTDRIGAAPVIIVNEAMARHLWPGTNPLGQCVKVGAPSAPCSTVVGVAANARQGNIVRQSIQYERVRDAYYLPLEQQPPQTRFKIFGELLYVRASGDAVSTIPAVRRAVLSEMPGTGVPDVTAFAAAVEPQVHPWRVGVLMFGLFGAIGFLLALIGIHGMLAFRVNQRRKELGVRMALGATAADVYRTVVGQGARVAAIGIAIGVLSSLTIGHALGAILFGVSPRDPIVLTAIGSLMLCAAAVASFLPARAAVAIDVVRVLRDL